MVVTQIGITRIVLEGACAMKLSLSPTTRYIAFVCAIAVLLVVHHALAEVELPRKTMDLAKLVVDITVQINKDFGDVTPCEGCTDFQVFTGTRKWAVVTRTSAGYCLAVFSATLQDSDWNDNLNPGVATYCGEDENGKTTCCKMRAGFLNAYSYLQEQVEDALRTCADSCIDPDECVVLGGQSLGSAKAQVAALVSFNDLNPYIVGTGCPQTIYPGCALVSSERAFGFVNTFTNGTNLEMVKTDFIGLVYDVVPFLVPVYGASPLGKLFLMSDDASSVAFLGQDSLPKEISLTGHFDFDVHYLISKTRENEGYIDRVHDILEALDSGADLVKTAGFSTGSTCNFAFECESRHCASQKCI